MDILCVGDLNGDLIVPYGKALKQSKGEDPVQVSFRVGGTVSNTVQFLGRLGEHPYFVGDLCGDSIGRSIQEELRKLGVDLFYEHCLRFFDGGCIDRASAGTNMSAAPEQSAKL